MQTSFRKHPGIAAIALASAMGMAGYGAPSLNMQLKAFEDYDYDTPPLASLRPSRRKGRFGLNQRQIRKNRRRANAAGFKKAFK